MEPARHYNDFVQCPTARMLRNAYMAALDSSLDLQPQLATRNRWAIARSEVLLRKEAIEEDLRRARRAYCGHVEETRLQGELAT